MSLLIYFGYFASAVGILAIFFEIKNSYKKSINDVKKDTEYLKEMFILIQENFKLKNRLKLVDQYLRKNRNFSINEIEELNKKGKL
jgi:hypothetical protein